jgi:hypothetical protein
MPTEPAVDHERVYVFVVAETYTFKHFFDGEAVFDRLKEYYNNQQYRFEVPEADFDSLAEFLADHGYDLEVVEQFDEFVVVVEKYTAHPENIFKESVMQRGDREHNYFLMTDPVAVEQATMAGATRLVETPLDNPFS